MRSRYFDYLRCLAIIRVVVYHITGWAALTVLFPAMSVMFALAGSLMAASLDRWGSAAVGRRLRRLLPSLWLVAAVFLPLMAAAGGLSVSWRLLLWLAPLADPPTNAWGAVGLSVVWYLRDFLWFVLVSPVALRLFRRSPLATLVAPYLLLAGTEFGLPSAPLVLRDFGLYFGAWLLGFAQHDGLLRRLRLRVLVSLATALGTLGTIWIGTHPGPRGYDLNDIRIGNALWSAAVILLLFGAVPVIWTSLPRRWWTSVPRRRCSVRTGGSRRLDRLVTVVNQRALTVYLWHMPILVAVTPLAARLGWVGNHPVGLPIRLVAVSALVVVAVALFGWVEDLAARRRPVLLPTGNPGRRTGPPAVPDPRRAPDRLPVSIR